MELQKTEKSIDEGMQLQNVLRKEELLVKEAEELNPKELIISKKSSPEDLPSTALTANGVIHVDQLYKIPLTNFDPELENEFKVKIIIIY